MKTFLVTLGIAALTSCQPSIAQQPKHDPLCAVSITRNCTHDDVLWAIDHNHKQVLAEVERQCKADPKCRDQQRNWSSAFAPPQLQDKVDDLQRRIEDLEQ